MLVFDLHLFRARRRRRALDMEFTASSSSWHDRWSALEDGVDEQVLTVVGGAVAGGGQMMALQVERRGPAVFFDEQASGSGDGEANRVGRSSLGALFLDAVGFEVLAQAGRSKCLPWPSAAAWW
ncbi:hypothetical protein OHB05_42230 [Streptomyces sp. NBC_00638]|uniref:hypothetical protein n=1 Tax=Streptomyces sp. NBC_00638 TaxID=2975794 RepID=UPI00225AF826|nr:hypothetical protein [Streptomyces sp. NBC_00638]MCX5009138.1 hypothetical protein [Streptomyces sp. NBC_00638]